VETRDVDGLNAGYAELLLDEYLGNPDSVPSEWRALFESRAAELLHERPALSRLVELAGADGGGNGAAVAPPPAAEPAAAPAPAPAPAAAPDETLLGAVAAAMALVKATRTHGHVAARLDPLGSEPHGDPALEPERMIPPLTPDLQAQIPASVLRLYVDGDTLADALPRLRETYCGTAAYEIEHISEHEQRVWLRQAIESGKYRLPPRADEKRALLERLTEVEGLELYLRRSFLGQKQFSVEGLDVMIPMLDLAIELAAEAGTHEVVMGMAHRGRLNVLTHILGKPYDYVLREFEGERTIEAITADPEGGTGDVKYHLGTRATRNAADGSIRVTLCANPSHLEFVDPIVEGRARAAQTDRQQSHPLHDPRVALPILIHGDAAFPGQGVVAETLNLGSLAGYSTGGTLHLISNNQVGFTTYPADARSTRYSSDLAKGFDMPIFHVNADDPEAAMSVVRLAMAFRHRFAKDVVVDLVGYRRFGHNEQDEAAYTQPLMVERIQRHPTVREQYARRLVEEGVITEEDAERLFEQVQGRLREAHEQLKESFQQHIPPKTKDETTPPTGSHQIVTAVTPERLRALNEQLLTVPEGFTIHPKLAKQLERRRDALESGGIDWGHAEALAFATLLEDGIPIRLTGQDTERGTFSHRHIVLHDSVTGEVFTPVRHVPGAKASFEVHNSPLSENAALGFEYGYTTAAPEALVLWEAQFGDFVNGAQVIVDQFIVSGLSKWRQQSHITLLLPHGYEGNGPEHSNAKPERFLQLAAQENIRVANCTTAAQYFHLLRRQALDPEGRPLIVLTPKGLLRLRDAASSFEELVDGSFRPVIDDPAVEDHSAVRRLLLCSGKVYYDIVGHAERASAEGVAVARLEQLYPFPVEAARALVAAYPSLEEFVWVQEEPQNMGAWRAIRHRLEEASPQVQPTYVGRPWRASPSEGYPTAHLVEQDRIVRAALRLAPRD
jgi:2-oxoglutarate dehydrogenase E1 component